jgi:hypothetical protein
VVKRCCTVALKLAIFRSVSSIAASMVPPNSWSNSSRLNCGNVSRSFRADLDHVAGSKMQGGPTHCIAESHCVARSCKNFSLKQRAGRS